MPTVLTVTVGILEPLVDDEEEGKEEEGFAAKNGEDPRSVAGSDRKIGGEEVEEEEEEEEEEESLPSLVALRELVGLGEVKERCENLVDAVALEKERGDDPKQKDSSMVVTGNPGTSRATQVQYCRLPFRILYFFKPCPTLITLSTLSSKIRPSLFTPCFYSMFKYPFCTLSYPSSQPSSPRMFIRVPFC